MSLPPEQQQQHVPYTQHIIGAIYECIWAKQLHYHASFFSPTKSKYLQAIRNVYLQGYVGLMYKGAKWHITDTEQAAIQEHLK